MNAIKTILSGSNLCFSKRCSVTHKEYSIVISFPKYVMWKEDKKLIQNVFPELDEDEREFLISGHTPAEWDTMMAEPDDFCIDCGKDRGSCPCENTLR